MSAPAKEHARIERAYNATFRADMNFFLSRWALLKLLLRVLVSPKRPAYELLFKGGGHALLPMSRIVLGDLRHVSRFQRGGLVISPISRMTDPLATAYRDGQRDLYIRILLMIGLDGGAIGDSHAET
jgi:hypothetical protein